MQNGKQHHRKQIVNDLDMPDLSEKEERAVIAGMNQVFSETTQPYQDKIKQIRERRGKGK